jgi:hypothetical protein
MKSVEEMLNVLKKEAKYDPDFVAIVEFIESLREDVVFCQGCKKLRLDPGVEMTMTVTTSSGEKRPKKLEFCGPCLEEFLGKVGSHASEVEYELESGTTIRTTPVRDPDPHPAAMMRPDPDYKPPKHIFDVGPEED